LKSSKVQSRKPCDLGLWTLDLSDVIRFQSRAGRSEFVSQWAKVYRKEQGTYPVRQWLNLGSLSRAKHFGILESPRPLRTVHKKHPSLRQVRRECVPPPRAFAGQGQHS